jgi:hypothetical protein
LWARTKYFVWARNWTKSYQWCSAVKRKKDKWQIARQSLFVLGSDGEMGKAPTSVLCISILTITNRAFELHSGGHYLYFPFLRASKKKPVEINRWCFCLTFPFPFFTGQSLMIRFSNSVGVLFGLKFMGFQTRLGSGLV